MPLAHYLRTYHVEILDIVPSYNSLLEITKLSLICVYIVHFCLHETPMYCLFYAALLARSVLKKQIFILNVTFTRNVDVRCNVLRDTSPFSRRTPRSGSRSLSW